MNNSVPAQFNSLLRGKRIFLTGGTGLFGKWLLDCFQSLEVDLVLLTRNSTAFRKTFPLVDQLPNVSFVDGDVRSFNFPAGHFDYVIHAATPVVSDDLSGDNAELTSVIVEGTKHVLKFAESNGVDRLLYVSSGAVYGVQPPELERIPETHPCNPVTAYGKGKLAAEQLCLDSDIDSVIARCFAFIGPYMPLDEHFAIGNFIGNGLRNEPIIINGDGTPIRSYMYATDLVEWLIRLLLKGTIGECYNVGSDISVSIADLAHLVRDVAGSENKILIRQKASQNQFPVRYVPDVGKIIGQLDLKQKVDLKEAVQRAAQLMENQDA